MPTQAGETTCPPPVGKGGAVRSGSLPGWGRGVLLFAQPQVPAWGKPGPGAEETGQQRLRAMRCRPEAAKLREGLSAPVSFPQPAGKVGMKL